MIAGHYATALVPYELTRKTSPAPFWLFLVASQFLDVLMLLLVSFGVEKLEPSDFLKVAFVSMRSEMFVSHDIVPVFGWAILFGAIAWGLTKNRTAALWRVGLVLLHELFDLVVGFKHYVLGEDTMSLGLDLYNRAPIAGMLIEAALCAALVFLVLCTPRQQEFPGVANVEMGPLRRVGRLHFGNIAHCNPVFGFAFRNLKRSLTARCPSMAADTASPRPKLWGPNTSSAPSGAAAGGA